MAAEHVEGLLLGCLGVLDDRRGGCVALLFKLDDLLAALVEVDVKEDKLLIHFN